MDILVDQLSARVEGQNLFEPLSFNVAAGQTFCFWGPSGRGKTSLLKILTGFSDRYEGSLFWNGEDLKRTSLEVRATVRQKKIRLHWQQQNLFPELTVKENILLGCDVLAERDLWVEEQIDYLDLPENKKTVALSWGERHRVSMVRALVCEPEVVLIDEPFSSLDEQTVKKVSSWLVKQQGELSFSLIVTAHKESLPFDAHFIFLERVNE